MRAFVVRAFVFALVSSGALALGLWAVPAHAGDYGIGAYGPGYVWTGDGCCRAAVVQPPPVVYYRAGALQPGYCPRVFGQVVPPHRRVRLSEFDYYTRYPGYGHVGCYWRETPIHVWRGGWAWGRATTCY